MAIHGTIVLDCIISAVELLYDYFQEYGYHFFGDLYQIFLNVVNKKNI